jgi:hypothetical protein
MRHLLINLVLPVFKADPDVNYVTFEKILRGKPTDSCIFVHNRQASTKAGFYFSRLGRVLFW